MRIVNREQGCFCVGDLLLDKIGCDSVFGFFLGLAVDGSDDFLGDNAFASRSFNISSASHQLPAHKLPRFVTSPINASRM